MQDEEFYYENLRNQTINLLEELKDSKNQETLKEKISSLWKNIPLPSIKKETDILLSKCKYEHSEETTIYMIIYHLFTTGNVDVINEFYAEYEGKHKKFINICINNYKEFVSYTNKFKEGDYSMRNFIDSLGISDELIFYYNIHLFLENEDPIMGLSELKKSLTPISGNFTNELKGYLKCLVFPTFVKQKKEEVKIKLEELFILEFCKLRDFVNKDFLPLIFDQGCAAYKILQENNYAFKNFEDTILPIEIKLDPKREFHSLFVCPVIKEVCSDANKPVLLECNHVISSSAANILSKHGAVDVFKCPYCPAMTVFEKIIKLELYK